LLEGAVNDTPVGALVSATVTVTEELDVTAPEAPYAFATNACEPGLNEAALSVKLYGEEVSLPLSEPST
jgi:hypothetical protein